MTWIEIIIKSLLIKSGCVNNIQEGSIEPVLAEAGYAIFHFINDSIPLAVVFDPIKGHVYLRSFSGQRLSAFWLLGDDLMGRSN